MEGKNREKILELLQRDAKLAAAEIAVLLGLAEEDVVSEIAKME